MTNKVDLIINVVDSTNLEKNLYLTTQLAEMLLPMFFALNIMELAKVYGINIDPKKLSEGLGYPVYAISAVQSSYIDNLRKEILSKAQEKPLTTCIQSCA